LATGRSPAFHGVIGNEIYDRRSGSTQASIDDPETGKSARRLKAPTLADALRTRHPDSRIVSISSKDRSAVLLGGQDPSIVLWFDYVRHGFVTSAAYGALPAWVPPINATLSRFFNDISPPFWKPDWSASPSADRAVLAMALAALKHERLGRHASPDLLMISFSATDSIGHRWGPDSPQMEAQLKEIDARLGELIAATEAAAPGRTVYALSSDHGILPIPESEAGRSVGARRVPKDGWRRRMDEKLRNARGSTTREIIHLALPDLYLRREPGTGDREWAAWVREAAALIAGGDDVAAVYVPGEPAPEDGFVDFYRRSHFPGLSGDLQVRMKPGVLLTGTTKGTSHGGPYPYDVDVPVILWGAGIRPVRSTGAISVESLAPTLAEILRVSLPATDARVLTEALER